MYKVIQSSRLYEQIVQQIEDSILKGELTEGSQLPAERELAEQFGVSRTAVREAIKALQEKGLVDAFPGRGTFVTNGTSNSMRRSLDRIIKTGDRDGSTYLVEVREILEPEIAALAASRADYEDIDAMREAVEAMDSTEPDSEAFIEADLDFHLALAEAAANPIVLSLIDSIVGLLREQRVRISFVEGSPERGQRYHRSILEAIERHDAQAARAAMQAHLWQVREDSRNTPGNQPAES
ncbi:MAG TPA: FadR/GntR family transcriptional regulator [Candidatus Saccharimonadales bacterium]|nr:FadR/GntR family transcriptional regulator [Candidatus Saccharimonadales bacterium]